MLIYSMSHYGSTNSKKDALMKSVGERTSQLLSIQPDEMEVLETYRRAKALKFADINIAIQEGLRVKLWLTEKKK